MPQGLKNINGGLPRLRSQLAKQNKKPSIGVTFGGSSRPNAPAKSAASNGLQKKPKTKPWKEDE